jgi:hypothetical protein
MAGGCIYPKLYQLLPAAYFVYIMGRALAVYYAHACIHPLRTARIYHIVIAAAVAMVYPAFEYETHGRKATVRVWAYACMFCIHMLWNFQVCMVQQQERVYLFCFA